MSLLVCLVLAGMALCGALAVAAHRMRRQRLDRLDHVVGDAAPVRGHTGDGPSAGHWLLPRALMRNASLLGLAPRPRDVMAVLGGLVAAMAAMATLLGPFAGLGLGAVLLLAGRGLLGILAARRVAELGALMPGFFDRVRQLLTIGNSLPVAFERAVSGSPPKLAVFFAATVRRINNGANFTESIQQSADAIGLYEMHLFAAAAATNARFGGSLGHALGNLVAYLRKRAAIERELRANTAQIRASAWVLGLLPLLVGGLVLIQNHEYASWFITHPQGRKMLVYCVLSQGIGALLMRNIVRMRF